MKLRPHQARSLTKMALVPMGQVYVPTGGGKTLIMIRDLMRRLEESDKPFTALIVAPRILLANQLCAEFTQEIKNAVVAHVHSGETKHFSTTNPDHITMFHNMVKSNNEHQLLFTTYHSLHRVIDSGIHIDTVYFDEAHNACKRDFFVSTAMMSQHAESAYYFTATPKLSQNPKGRGMNNSIVFGRVIENVPAPELIENGSIIPPMVQVYEVDGERDKDNAAKHDAKTLLAILDGLDANKAQKVLVAAPSTKVLCQMLFRTDVMNQFRQRGYEILHITSKEGAYVNDQKVNREVFFDTMTKWGQDKQKKFVLFHYSILSEGINCPGLTHSVLLRNLNVIEMCQTIGRVIRVDREDAQDMANGVLTPGDYLSYRKSYGFVTVPVHKNHGKNTQQRLQSVVDFVFRQGIPPEYYVD
jgi:superfamily II DNA or RNA helicase